MNEILNFPFHKPELLDRSDEAKRIAGELRAKGCTVGVTVCLKCEMLSSYFFSGEPNTPKDWANIMCPACGHVGSIFLHDTECLDDH